MHQTLIVLSLITLLAACAQPSAGVDWRDWTAALQSEGGMRTDRGAGVPLPDADELVSNFAKIGFSLEGAAWTKANQQDDAAPRILRRWVKPLVYKVWSIGSQDSDFVDHANAFMDRLGEITGHPVKAATSAGDANDAVGSGLLILHASDAVLKYITRPGGPLTSDADPGRREFKQSLMAHVAEWRIRPSPCTVLFWHAREDSDEHRQGEMLFAVSLMRTEMPDHLLDACIEEELAQSMGLLADHPNLRPSIFNDDQEFALLTRQDELLLKILYDPRLSPGMSPEIAMPIVREIARELTSGL